MFDKIAKTSPRRLQCNDCDYTTRSHDALSKHSNEKHRPAADSFQPCQYCHFSSTDAEKVRQHVAHAHVRLRKYNCKQCDYIGKSYIGKSQRCLEQHMSAEHRREGDDAAAAAQTCQFCPFEAGAADEMRRHLDSEHFEEGDEKSFKCETCDFSASKKSRLIEHEARQHLFCKKCGFSTVFGLRLAVHMKTCLGNSISGKIKIRETEKPGNSPSEKLDSGYLYIEGDDKPYNCPDCGFDAASKRVILKHVEKCSKGKGKTRSDCDEGDMTRVKDEIIDFVVKEPYPTNKRQRSPQGRNGERRTITSKSLEVSDNRRRFKCPKCKLTFSDKDTAMLHTRKRHYKCDSVNCQFFTTHFSLSQIHMRDCLRAKSRNSMTRGKSKNSNDIDDGEVLIVAEKQSKQNMEPPRVVNQVDKAKAVKVYHAKASEDSWSWSWSASEDNDCWGSTLERVADPDPEGTQRIAERIAGRNVAGIDYFRKLQEEFAKRKEVESLAENDRGRESDSGNESKGAVSDNDEEMKEDSAARENAIDTAEDRVDDEEEEGTEVEPRLLEPIVSVRVEEEEEQEDESPAVSDRSDLDKRRKRSSSDKESDKRPKKEKKKAKRGLPPFFSAFLRGKAEKDDSTEKDSNGVDGDGDSGREEEEGEKAACDLCPHVAADQNLLTAHILQLHVVG